MWDKSLNSSGPPPLFFPGAKNSRPGCMRGRRKRKTEEPRGPKGPLSVSYCTKVIVIFLKKGESKGSTVTAFWEERPPSLDWLGLPTCFFKSPSRRSPKRNESLTVTHSHSNHLLTPSSWLILGAFILFPSAVASKTPATQLDWWPPWYVFNMACRRPLACLPSGYPACYAFFLLSFFLSFCRVLTIRIAGLSGTLFKFNFLPCIFSSTRMLH